MIRIPLHWNWLLLGQTTPEQCPQNVAALLLKSTSLCGFFEDPINEKSPSEVCNAKTKYEGFDMILDHIRNLPIIDRYQLL